MTNNNFASSFGKSYYLYYNVQKKVHSEENWTNLWTYLPDSDINLLPQSNSQYTTIFESVQSLPANIPLDFRVQSFLIKITSVYGSPNYGTIGTSDWSKTQTVTIPESSTSASPSPTPTSTFPGPIDANTSLLALDLLVFALIVVFVVAILLFLYLMHRKERQ
jgi:hypothetical protein